jgi:HSP20 family protein
VARRSASYGLEGMIVMADQVPVRREQRGPAAQEGEILPAWRGPADVLSDIDTVFDRMVRNFFDLPRTAGLWGGGFTPAVDIEETADSYIFDIDLPGVARDQIKIEAGHNELHVSGEVTEKERTGTMRHRTRRTGSYSYRVALPAGCDPDAISAAYNEGVLTITVPRSETSKPRRINIT